MTSRTRPARCTTEIRSPPWAALALLAGVALCSACGILSRPMLARHDTASADTAAEHAALLGAEPMLPQLWLWSAQRQPDMEAALALLERGRRFHPGDHELLLAQLSLLNLMERADAVQALARNGLQGDCPPFLEAELRWTLIAGLLAGHDTAAAEAEVARLGGVRGVSPGQVADAWARIAATHEFLGHAAQADAAVERSLDLGPAGLPALREIAAREPQRQAACEALLSRARARHPGHPDLALQRVVTALLARDAAAADEALAQLPTPLPERLERDLELQRAQVDVLAGRIQPALAVLRARLNDDPGDAQALAVLIECWRMRQAPSAEELRLRLSWAEGRISHPGLAAQVHALLRELPPPPAEPPESAPASAPASGSAR